MLPKFKHSTLPLKYHVPLFQLAANYSQRGEHNTLSQNPLKYVQLFTPIKETENNRIFTKNYLLENKFQVGNVGAAHFHFPISMHVKLRW